ncbi:MAG: prefoldin subunit [Candidatus Heimdallarchaeota archaeon]|nr:prefoldin subunit [Candidatus Heimdallarchaeota archaeon]MDH5646755.1 prefoldin subunit [Candidatus Heimdallarchaeota archaeon]
MSRPSLSQQQQQELQKLQQMSQQLSSLQQNYYQMQGRQRELENTLKSIAELPDTDELYRNVGQLMFKSQVGKTRVDLTEQLELIEIRVKQAKKQVDDLEKIVKETESKLRASIQ